jgi:2-amino-4-hydroxy-6-hydroxymethyldihydropteridine diphosphokinase
MGVVGDWVYVALGSNLGDSRMLVREAMNRLESLSVIPLRRSSLWRSVPVGCPPGSLDFINAVVGFRPGVGETPESLLDRFQGLEREFGRRPKRVPNEARPLDMDLLVFGMERRETERLTLPHPRIRDRAFVLAPWAEIDAGFVLPGVNRSVGQLLAALGPLDGVRRVEVG